MTLSGLPWYYLPETERAQDTFWSVLARHLRRQGIAYVPHRLTRGRPVQSLLTHPGLIFGQCCGYDLIYGFSGTVTYLATPRYAAPGCSGADYSSFVLVRDDAKAAKVPDLRGSVGIINGFNSHSGANALRAVVAPFSRKGRFFAGVKVSGGHLQSLAMLVSGAGDVMAMDCVLHVLLTRHRPAVLDGTRVIDRSDPVPAPPFVTSAAFPPETAANIREALAAAVADPAAEGARQDLLLDGVDVLPPHKYLKIVELEASALRKHYLELHATAPAVIAAPTAETAVTT